VEHAEPQTHIVPYGTLVRVWLLLLVLTAILVFTTRVYHESMAVYAMLVISPLKAGLVFFYFMHLKYEKPFLKALVLMTLALLVLFIGFMFLDLSYR
jgi:cytochrome c oxidase subunit 4